MKVLSLIYNENSTKPNWERCGENIYYNENNYESVKYNFFIHIRKKERIIIHSVLTLNLTKGNKPHTLPIPFLTLIQC